MTMSSSDDPAPRTPFGLGLGVVVVLVAPIACTEAPPDRASKVGRRHYAWSDSDRQAFDGSRPRPLAATVWYPTEDPRTETLRQISVFRFGWSILDADLPADNERRPLAVLSHGTGGSAAQLSWLAEALAARGFVVAAVNHHGNTAAEESLTREGFTFWWERPPDLSRLVDRILEDSDWSTRVDPERIVAAGFSLGGYTVFALAGAQISLARYNVFCEDNGDDPACLPPPESQSVEDAFNPAAPRNKRALARANDDFSDPRIRAVAAVAPVLAPAITPQSLSAFDRPTSIVVGELDEQAFASAQKYRDALGQRARFEALEGVSHYTFLAPCSLRGRLFVGALCGDDVDREDVHRAVASDVLSFFRQTLGDLGAR